MFNAKDFIETESGLIFAVVSDISENDSVLCFLRYALTGGKWIKLSTQAANSLLQQNYPEYFIHSDLFDADLHAVPFSHVHKHHQPRRRLAELMGAMARDQVEHDCQQVCSMLERQGIDLDQVGVTGSLLPALQNSASDIDLVFYEKNVFHSARFAVQRLIGLGGCQELEDQDWLESYSRRDCDLSLQEYVWHERRKFNKVMINGRKVELNLFVEGDVSETVVFNKLGEVVIRVRVTDDECGFDYPAEFSIDHDEIESVVSFTATYNGQAKTGEMIEVRGQLEQSSNEVKRIVVGSSREAKGEYIKVVHAN